MSKVGCIAKIPAQAGKRDELVAAMQDMMRHVESEEGTLHYVLHADKKDDNVVWVTELYADDAALAAHGGSDVMKALMGKLGGLLGGAPELIFTSPLQGKGL